VAGLHTGRKNQRRVGAFASLGKRQQPVNQDFRDLLSEFNARKVEFLVVGAHALAAHGYVRATRDLDVWCAPSPTVRHACYASAVADMHSYHLPFRSPANRPNPKRSFLSRFFSQ